MSRLAFLLVLAFALPGAQALQVDSHGVPASVLSPTSPGSAHGVPSSILSPTPATRLTPNGRLLINTRRFHARFGNPHRRARVEFVPVPIFIPAYPIDGAYSYSDSAPEADQAYAPDDSNDSAPADENALNEAYNRGARDALLAQQRRADRRYGEHYLDAREQARNKDKAAADKSADKPETSEATETAPATENSSAAPEPDNTPSTVFIFKDGHRIETRNYAILGQTLIDFSDNTMRKIQLTDLDLNATKKANDDLGITLRLPSAP